MFNRPHLAVFVALLALFGALLIVGCNPDNPQSILDAKGPVAQRQLDLYWIIFWMALFVFVVVGGGLLYTVIRFRRRPGQGIPAQVHGNTKLEIGWTVVPAIMLAVIAVPTVISQFYISNAPSGDQLQINVTAHQWWWEVQYPDSGVVTANELHVPVGMTVSVELTSADVLHSFWVPKLAGKMDIFPGKTTSMWFRADEVGEYFGQCAEFCGESHAWMRFRVITDTPEDFEAWTASQLAQAAKPATPEATAGAGLFLSKACIQCHSTTPGVPTAGFPYPAPNLTHFGGRTTMAAGIMEMNAANLREWLSDPNEVKPGNIMAKEARAYTDPASALSSDDIDNLVAYLQGLR
ncbi:MAG: cytochrome c oxidase subunit II [Chloroflexi bacterium]|nr:cytochrome c oxidase subunit II [Chloroflexota bacterium]